MSVTNKQSNWRQLQHEVSQLNSKTERLRQLLSQAEDRLRYLRIDIACSVPMSNGGMLMWFKKNAEWSFFTTHPSDPQNPVRLSGAGRLVCVAAAMSLGRLLETMTTLAAIAHTEMDSAMAASLAFVSQMPESEAETPGSPLPPPPAPASSS